MKFQIWHKKKPDGRATEAVFLNDDYNWVGEIEANSPKDLVSVMVTADHEDLELVDNRPLRIGDVVQDALGVCYIFTPSSVWAKVQTFE